MRAKDIVGKMLAGVAEYAHTPKTARTTAKNASVF